jgi:exosortase A
MKTSPASTQNWYSYLALLFVSISIQVWIFRDTAQSLLSLWLSSETYVHGFIIFPISLYLIWQKRRELGSIAPKPGILALAMLILLNFGWVIAQSADVQIISQYMFVAMISALITALFGWRFAGVIAFPLAFTLLAVPFGEIFIRPLIEFTADFTVAALNFTNIPVYREGSQFSLATGNWSVVDACSGLRYLISSFTLGCLYAYLNYRSRWRQIIFVIISIIVPVFANGLRAYFIVLLGYFSNMTIAVGFDHLIYGWLFFGLVMAILFWIGNKWREDEPTINADFNSTTPVVLPPKTYAIAVMALFIMWSFTVWLTQINQSNPIPVTLALPENIGKWSASPSSIGLNPAFPGARLTLMQEYHNGNHAIGVYLAFFRNQNVYGKAISVQNILAPGRLNQWSVSDESERELSIMHVRETRLIRDNKKMLAWQWYRIGDTRTSNPYLVKLLQAKSQLTGHGDDSLDVVIFAPYEYSSNEAVQLMQDFLSEANPVLLQSIKYGIKAQP